MDKHLHLVRSDHYIDDLIRELRCDPEYIEIIYFRMFYEGMLQRLLPELLRVLHNGCKVQIYIDPIFSLKILHESAFPAYFGAIKQHVRQLQHKTKDMYNQLREAGANVYEVNQPGFINASLLPFTKRDHRKVIVIHHRNATKTAYFGATNLSRDEYNDYMIRTHNPEIIAAIESINSISRDSLNDKNQAICCNDFIELLYDCGKSRSSLILKKAIDLISKAKKKITFVSQLPPEPQLMYHFRKIARKGVHIEIVIPEEKRLLQLPSKIALYVARTLIKNTNITIHHTSHGFTHAKILLVDDTALVGSHNLSYFGVYCQTKELSALISDPIFVSEIQGFINSIR